MRNRDELKMLLSEIRSNDCLFPNELDIYELSLDMLKYLGDTESELRDKLIYYTFWHIYNKNYLSNDQKINILNISLGDDYLFYGIENKCDDSVFKRAFTTLVLSLTLESNNRQEFLSEFQVLNVYDRFLEYFNAELDKRGFVPLKGWADATCHGADVVYALGRSNALKKDELSTLLNLIKDKICINEITYITEEDERFVSAFSGIYDRDLFSNDEIIQWINSFKDFKKIDKYPEDLRIIINIKHFLRSLYFYFKKLEGKDKILAEIETVLEVLN